MHRESTTTQPELRPSDDYYASAYEPTALLDEWQTLRRELAHMQAQSRTNAAIPSERPRTDHDDIESDDERGRRRRAQPKHRSPSPEPVLASSTSRGVAKVRNSLALELHYAASRGQKHHRRHHHHHGGSAHDEDTSSRSRSVDDTSSSKSATTSSTSNSAEWPVHERQPVRAVYSPIADPYDRNREVERQEQFMSESKRLGRPFVPVSSNQDAPTRLLLGDCVRDLYKAILRDWPKAEPMIISTAEDLIVVYFSLHHLTKKRTAVVLDYMNSFAKRNETVREFKLDRVSEGWDVLTEDGHLMYTFRPPWVKKGKRFLPDTVSPAIAHVR